MQFELYIYLDRKQDSYYKAAMAEYEKRLSRYCKLKVRYLKKEKDVRRCLEEEEDIILLGPGREQMSSEELAAFIGGQENSGRKRLVYLIIGEKLRDSLTSFMDEQKGIRQFSLSLFNLDAQLEGLILEEQIYRAYRILNNHPYHK